MSRDRGTFGLANPQESDEQSDAPKSPNGAFLAIERSSRRLGDPSVLLTSQRSVLALPETHELADLVRDAIIERYWPHNLQTDAAIESHIRATVDQLRKRPELDVDADFNSYGSGFASYVHVFCTKSDRRSTRRIGETDWIDGIGVYLGRLVPFAAYGAENRTKHPRGGSGGFIDCRNLETTPDGSWEAELTAILRCLGRAGFVVLPKTEYCRPLPIRLEWETNFGTDTYFDAIYHWYD